jgi:hypothetical protein
LRSSGINGGKPELLLFGAFAGGQRRRWQEVLMAFFTTWVATHNRGTRADDYGARSPFDLRPDEWEEEREYWKDPEPREPLHRVRFFFGLFCVIAALGLARLAISPVAEAFFRNFS